MPVDVLVTIKKLLTKAIFPNYFVYELYPGISEKRENIQDPRPGTHIKVETQDTSHRLDRDPNDRFLENFFSFL